MALKRDGDKPWLRNIDQLIEALDEFNQGLCAKAVALYFAERAGAVPRKTNQSVSWPRAGS
jgi:hypothetical protein